MKTDEPNHQELSAEEGATEPYFQAEEKDVTTPILEDYAKRLDTNIREALEDSDTSFFEVKERENPTDFSEVAENIWEALNEIDDSPVAQLIHGVVYGVTDMAVNIASAIYEKVAERFGETLTTTINDADAFKRLVEPLVNDVQSDIEAGGFDSHWMKSPEQPFLEPEDLDPQALDQKAVSQDSSVDYLSKHLTGTDPEPSPGQGAAQPSTSIER